MNRSKKKAFERLARKHADKIPLIAVYRNPPGMRTLMATRRAKGWDYIYSTTMLEPPPLPALMSPPPCALFTSGILLAREMRVMTGLPLPVGFFDGLV